MVLIGTVFGRDARVLYNLTHRILQMVHLIRKLVSADHSTRYADVLYIIQHFGFFTPHSGGSSARLEILLLLA